MPTQRTVVHWLVLTAIMLMIIGVSTYQRSAFALVLLAAGLQMRSEWWHRQQVERELQDALASVEHQVAVRTEALLAARRVAETASQLKDEFLATASHELRTPLNAIVGWVHVLQSGGADDAQRTHGLAAIARNAKIQTRLIEDLLDVSRMIQGRVSLTMTPVDARTFVQGAVDAFTAAATAKHVTLTVARPHEPVVILGDEPRLQQVVGNLLANAVKYTPGGGTIRVSTTSESGRALIRVADTGGGIEAAFLPHVFDPFRQGTSSSMRTGMGLGLAIVRRLVDLHGGQITADSAGPDQGAVFTVSLPLAPAVAMALGARAPSPVFPNLKVMVVEDDVDSAAAVTAILQLHGCQTQTAASAAEGLRLLREWPADVLVCDIGLPDDDGYGLLRRLRSLTEGGQTPAIALTAYARPEDRARALAAGFRAHLSKPLDPELLLREIALAVESAPNASLR